MAAHARRKCAHKRQRWEHAHKHELGWRGAGTRRTCGDLRRMPGSLGARRLVTAAFFSARTEALYPAPLTVRSEHSACARQRDTTLHTHTSTHTHTHTHARTHTRTDALVAVRNELDAVRGPGNSRSAAAASIGSALVTLNIDARGAGLCAHDQ